MKSSDNKTERDASSPDAAPAAPLPAGSRSGAGSSPSPLRAVALTTPLLILNAFWVIEAEKVGRGPYFSCLSLFANVFFILTALIGANALVRRFLPRIRPLTQGELLLVYTMLAIGTAIAGNDFLPLLVMMMGHVTWMANGSNGWQNRFGQYLPGHLVVTDREALKGYYEGHSTLYTAEHLHAWLGPLACWFCFVVALVWCMMCLNVLVRQGWQDRERLPFPVVEIPIQMTEPGGGLWKSPVFWIGFGICALLEINNGLAYLYPAIPEIPIKAVNVQGQGLFATHPWNAVGYTCYSFYPFVVGLGYLLPLDLSFSCWFFYLFWKAQMIVSATLALDATPDFPYVREQSFGGYMAVLVFMFWNGRSYFRQVWRRIIGEPSEIDDQKEALSYRQAGIGFLIGFVFLVVFMIRAGLSPLIAIAAFGIYFALSLAITRMRAELGPPVHDLHFSGPDYLLTHEFGTPAFSTRDLTVLSFFYWFNRAYRCHPMPFGIEAMKAVGERRSQQRAVLGAVMFAVVVGTIATFWIYLHLGYALGTQANFAVHNYVGDEAFNRLNGWIQSPQPPNHGANIAIGAGFLFCALLMIARSRFPWWPFHPFGYAISSSWAMNNVWLPLLIAWVAKGLILRYGGVRLFRAAMPLFLGMILGEIITGSLWHLIGLMLGIQPYSFWTG